MGTPFSAPQKIFHVPLNLLCSLGAPSTSTFLLWLSQSGSTTSYHPEQSQALAERAAQQLHAMGTILCRQLRPARIYTSHTLGAWERDLHWKHQQVTKLYLAGLNLHPSHCRQYTHLPCFIASTSCLFWSLKGTNLPEEKKK